jgi:hypothetical protein
MIYTWDHTMLLHLNGNNNYNSQQLLTKIQQIPYSRQPSTKFQQPHLGRNTFIYTRGLIEIFPTTTLVLSYRNKIFELLRIYYSKILGLIYKRKLIKTLLQATILKKNTFPIAFMRSSGSKTLKMFINCNIFGCLRDMPY